MESLLDTRPIFHKCDERIRRHVFCSFLFVPGAAVAQASGRPVGPRRVDAGVADVIRDLDSIVEMEVTIKDKGYIFRGQSSGVAGKVFQACGVALPPILRPVGTALKNDSEEGKPCH